MKINNEKYNISFKKQLKAKAAIVGKSGSEPCNIYQLELPQDAGYYYKMAKSNSDWAQQKFLVMNMQEFLKGQKDKEFFVLEDSEDKGIGYITITHETDSDKKKNLNIEFLETCPAYSGQKTKREKKYIGETLMAFITAKAKKEKKHSVRVPSPISVATPFYKEKCGFDNEKAGSSALRLLANKFDSLLGKNAKHTDVKVELIG